MSLPITKELLKQCMPFSKDENIELFLAPMNNTLEKYEINTPERVASFLAQLAHESGSFRYVRELASGEAYEGRKDLGNTHNGDGVKFKGRGLIQITGRFNYQALSEAFGVDFITNPEKLETPEYATLSAGWFWDKRNLNELADSNNFRLITKRINGGYNGMEDRLKHWSRCKQALNILEKF